MSTVEPEYAAELRAALAAVTAKLDSLTALVEGLARPGETPAPAGQSAGDALWHRLGLSEGERRTVTVLFADVSGFTELSEKLDAESFQLVMKDTMSVLASCVSKYDGYLEKFIGDALCAIFGAPVAHEDEPQRAARAALAMHQALAERAVNRPDIPALTVHAGINTGIVIAGTVGDGSQFGVVGDTINTAARMMGLAQSKETFVTAETARRIRRQFKLEDRGLHEAKGKAQPLAAFNLVAELSAEERADEQVLRAPLVGRDRELATLRELAARAATGDGTTVLVVGEDGVGTTRLATEVATELEASGGWQVLRGSARVQAETPLGMIATALGPLLQDLPEGEARQLSRVLLAGGVAIPHDFELVLGEVVSEAARRRPLVIVLDDADEADPGSIEMVRYLSRMTGLEPVLWILTGSNVPAAFVPLVGASPDVVSVELEPLTDAALSDLFEALFPGAFSAPQRDRLSHLAEGNAEFAEEIALAMLDDGVVVEGDDGRWSVVGDPDAIDLPGSVSELIEARVDHLATGARVTLQDAAVIGVRFSEALLERIATVPSSVDAALAELAAAELVLRPPPDDPTGYWSFRSRLVREVAYESILRRRRPTAHRAVADALLELEPDRQGENADLFALHYEESDDPPLAVPHLIEAIDRAEFTYNLSGALDRARRAMKLSDRFPGRVSDGDIAWLHQRLGINKLMLGDRFGHVDLEKAVELFAGVGGPAEVASLEDRVGWYLTVGGAREAAVPHLQRAQAIAENELEGTTREGVLAGVAATRAFAIGADGDLTIGISAVDGAEHEARAAGDRFAECRALLVGGVLRLWAGAIAEAVDHLRRALELAWSDQFGTLADRCGRWLVLGLVEAGRYREAVELAQPLLARADDRGDPSVGVGVRSALAGMWRQVGDLEQAQTLAAEAVAIAEERHVTVDACAEAYMVLAHAALDAVTGPDVEADAHNVAVAIDRAERHALELGAVHELDPWLSWRSNARIAGTRARMALIAGNLDAAVTHAAEARAALGRATAVKERIAADRLEGEARARRGETAGLELTIAALADAEAMGSPYEVAEAAAAMARAADCVAPGAATAAHEREAAALAALRAAAPAQGRTAK